ncbi:MAG: DUF6444 domain-containing protein [Rhodobacteraceae bacterium]|nr:DUF6444 domain-containing protein [Paracoccaceae bacterium]MCY4195542.1 DUF6444 domain-containing protein [Paracoccaceae bacterium]
MGLSTKTAELAWRDSLIAEFRATVAAQAARIAELERRLGLDSSNSGRPPSSDGLAKPTAEELKERQRSRRQESGRGRRHARGPAVPATNNEAERALRPLKVQQKISGSFRSEAGARNHAALRTVLDTARKQGWNLLETLRTAPDELVGQIAAQQPTQTG